MLFTSSKKNQKKALKKYIIFQGLYISGKKIFTAIIN